MKNLTNAEIELWIDNVEELYWWASNYCKTHKCRVNKFISANKTDILNVIQRVMNGQ